jgi:hypothetical protein
MLFVFGFVTELVAPLHRGIGSASAQRERYRCDREGIGEAHIQEYAEFSWRLVFQKHGYGGLPAMMAFILKNNFFHEITPIVLALQVCRCCRDNHSSGITVSSGMGFSFTNTNTIVGENLCARGP